MIESSTTSFLLNNFVMIINSKNLERGLQAVSATIAKRSVMPILQTVKFEFSADELVLTTTNLETSMRYTIPCQSRAEGAVCVPFEQLVKLVKALPEQPITLLQGDGRLTVSTEAGKYHFSVENGEEFPLLPDALGEEMDMDAHLLRDSLTLTAPFCSSNEYNLALNGVFVELLADEMCFTATDGYRLMHLRLPTEAEQEEQPGVIIPLQAVNALLGVMPANGSVTVQLTDTNIFLRGERWVLATRLLDAKYPQYQNLLNGVGGDNVLIVEKADLLNALKRVAIFANKGTHQISLSLQGQHLSISAKDPDFSNEAKENLLVNYQGVDIEIGFNANLLEGTLKAIPGDIVRIELSEPNQGALVLPHEEDAFLGSLTGLIMPVMLSTYEPA